MAKRPLNLLIDEDLIRNARCHGIVLSRFLENKLQEYFRFIDAVSKGNLRHQWTGRDLNPWPPPCEGGDLPLIYQPKQKDESTIDISLFLFE